MSVIDRDSMRGYELIKIIGSKDENSGTVHLPKNVQRTLSRNNITDGLTNKRKISSLACEYLPPVRDLS